MINVKTASKVYKYAAKIV